MKLKNYYISFVLLFIGFIGFAQTPNNLLEDPSNKVKMEFKIIKTSKNISAKENLNNVRTPIIGPIDCLTDPVTGECVELEPCINGIYDPITGECILPNPPCLGTIDPITGECINIIDPDPCADCDGLCNQLTGECFDDINPPGGGSPSSSGYAGTTPGNFSVSLSGAASYSIPLSIPPGIKDIAPSIGFAYSSQASNGLAGWGWNLSGLSTISRIPSTDFHDGQIDGIDFDNKDRFALDGQRLMIKSGSYGSNGSEYQTENYSNIKIKAYGTSPYGSSYGPSYFIVFYPDGTKAWYGNGGSSNGRLEWSLYKRIDPQGNYIQYDYLQSNGLLRINRIKYGARGSSASPNEIRFYYKSRTRPEISYINNYTFKRTNILDRIEVKASGQLFRKYVVSHNNTTLGYQRVSSIKEYNSTNQSFPPITFTYESSSSGVQRDGNTLEIYPGINYNNDRMAVGEFNGDGKMDFITYNKNSRNKLNVFMDIFDDYGSGISIGYSVNTEKFDDVFASTILSWDGKILSQQGVTNVRETVNSSNSTARFRTFAMAAYGPVFQYDKNVNFPIGSAGDFDCDQPSNNDYRKIPKSFISGDFNGDGLTDVLAIPKKYYREVCQWDYDYWDDYDECVCHNVNVTQGNSEVYFVDLKRTASTNAVNIGSLAYRIQDSTDKLFGVDFDGDGKTDLMHIRDGLTRIYSMNSSNQLVQIASLTNSYIDKDKPILVGDYNGDGKTDFAQPSVNNSTTWRFYLSRGSNFYYYSKNIGVTYTENYVDTDHPWWNPIEMVNGVAMENPLYEYHYIAQDYNGDGKSDILKHEVVSPYSSYNTVSDRLMLYTNKHNSNESTPSFQLTTNSLATNNGLTKFGIPLFLEAKSTNSNLEYAYIDGNNVHTYEFNRDHKKDISLKKITNNGIVTDIFYERLDSRYGSNIYSFNYEENYPYANINVAPSFKLVKEVKHKASGHEQRQLFLYEGAVSHIGGLGFLGFKTFKKTNFFGDGVGKLWTISKHNPQKRGAVTQQWVSTSPSSSPFSFANKTDYTYSTQLLSNKVYVNIPTQINKEDGLQGFSSVENYTYDSYKNPLTISTTYPSGSNSVTYQYINNASSTGSTYHIGRPTKKIETNVISGNSFTTEIQFTYNNNLVTQTKNRGNGTPWLTENLIYDVFGNVKQKTLSASGIASRVEKFDYDSTGRYLIQKTDIEGLETQYNYNVFGNPITSTSPYGLTTTFEYDGWQRPSKAINYLGKETNTYYNNEVINGIGNCFTKLVDTDEGQDTKTYYNSFGWVIQTKTLGLDNQWVQKSFEHDVSGKTIKESEPYFSTDSANQWNQFYFDQYERPISTQLFTGKIINTTYNSLSATVDDGTKTVTTTKDASGNILSLQDPGGTITYQYYGNGAMKSANYGSHTVSVTIDGWGRKTALNDPSAGTYTYDYNVLGEILEETTPKGSTTHQYDDFGKVLVKEISGDNTAMTVEYYYDNTTRLLNSIEGLDEENGKSFIYNYEYDSSYRLIKTTETSDDAQYEKQATYDNFGRINSETYNSTSLISGTNSTVKVKHVFDDSGILVEMRDFNTNSLLWKANEMNARGQSLNIELGNGIIKTKQYDSYGFLENITEKVDGTGGAQALKLDYTFDTQRGILLNRKNYGFTNWNEGFSYDNLDRLTQISGAVPHSKEYDNRGRITNNSFVGDYNYVSGNAYRLANIDLNNQGDLYYQQHSLQQITYNAFKKPVSIFEEDKGRVDFEYGPMMNRTASYYGGLEEDKSLRKFQKIYSSIMPVEIVEDNDIGSTKIITYIGGDGYTAPLAHIKIVGAFGNDINEYHYLHRDYLGSILAITNSDTNIVEQRQFGAWGVTDAFKKGSDIGEFNHDSLIGRGFTGHEHFFEVSLIHMNGRMYDAQLGRFLSPDNHIQDPYNTQSFNRYGYVWNNPLSFNDPSGEIFWAIVGVAALIGAATGAATYIVNAIITGNWSWGGFAMSVLGGTVAGALAGIVAPGAFAGLFTNATAFFWGSVATGVASSFLPAVTIPIGDFSFSISPAIAFGSGAISAGANFSMSYSDGNFNASIGFGITYATKSHGSNTMGWEFRRSWAVNWDDGKTGLGIYNTNYSGFGGTQDQKVGGLLVRRGDFSMRYENDGGWGKKLGKVLGDGEDKLRSAAMKFGIGDFNIGFNVFTGKRNSSKDIEVTDKRGFFERLFSPIPRGVDGGYGANLPYGAAIEDGPKHRLGLGFIGWKNYRIGIDSYRHLGHAIQNIGAHYFASPQVGFTSQSNAIMPYFQYQTNNPYSLW